MSPGSFGLRSISGNEAEDNAEHDGDITLNDVAALVAMHVNQISETESSYGPPIALAEFLKRKTQSCAIISHPFSWSYPSPSRGERIQEGRVVRRITLPNFPLPEPVAYLRDLAVGICAVLFLQLRVS